MAQQPTSITFGPYRLDVQGDGRPAQLWHEDAPVELQARPLAVLRYLAERPGEVIAKEELLQEVWADTYVTRTTLKVCIRAIREALGDDAQQPRYIETVGRQGYRFISAGVAPEEQPAPPSSFGVVGRDVEVAQLQDALALALGGTRQMVFVTGEAGIGKTSVIDQFLTEIQDIHPVWMGRGQCIEQYGEGEAYLPVLEALGQLYLEPGGQVLPETLRLHAPTWLVQLPALLNDAEREALQRQVQGATRERMLREMAEALEVLTTKQSLVLVLEDLHWSDASTLDLLSYVAQRRQPAQLLILGTYRPSDIIVRDHPLRETTQELLAKRLCTEVALELLTQESVIEYIERRLSGQVDAVRLGQIIHERTEGNALFMVNVIDHLVSQEGLASGEEAAPRDGWAEEVEETIPSGLQQLIDKQIRQLTDAPQRTLEVASVAGSEFVVASVATGMNEDMDAIEEVCEELAERGQFIDEVGFAEWPDGTLSGQYRFRHALYQNVLYRRLGKARRVRLHRTIGEREESAYGEQARELAAELAVHFEQGRDIGKAILYHQHAGETALQRSAHQEALYHTNKGLELLANLPESPERNQQELTFQLNLGVTLTNTKGFAAPDVEQAYLRARTLCQNIEDVSALFPVLYGLWNFYIVRADLSTARELADQIFALAEQAQDSSLLLEAHNVQAQTQFNLGNPAVSRPHLEQGTQIYTPQEHHALAFSYGEDPGIGVRVFSAEVLWLLGYPDQAQEQATDAHRLAQELDHPFSLAQALWFGAQVHLWRGEADLVSQNAQMLIELCHSQDFALWLAGGQILAGWALTSQGQAEDGLRLLTEGLTAWRASGAEVMVTAFLALQVETYAKAAKVSEGLDALNEAFEQINKSDERYYEAEVYRLKGELVRGEESEEYFQKALEISRQQEAKSLELRAATSLSRLWQQQGKKSEALDLLAPVYKWFTEGFETADLKEAQALLEERV